MYRWTGMVTLMVLLSCRQESWYPTEDPVLWQVPQGFPVPPVPADNMPTHARWVLGKKLFFDPVMSRDRTVSCASCHLPAFSFSDTVAFSKGVEGRTGTRNAPSLANVAYHPYLMREGGVPTLEMQVAVPVQEHHELDDNLVLIGERLREDSLYVRMAREAYDRDPDPYVITRAIAVFERSLLSGDSPYDRYVAGHSGALSASQRRGMALFFSARTQCAGCHGGFNFTYYSFSNNGLYVAYDDPGRYRLTGLEDDRALFKTPSLRNVAVTAPYMHDGSIPDLRAVVEHYRAGGAGHPRQDSSVRPLDLSDEEAGDLVAFLHALTDDSFLQNPLFRPGL